jgi:hypothetical protein
MGWVVNATPRSLYPQERDPVPILQGGEWVPGPVRNGYGKFRHHRGYEPRTAQPVTSRYQLRYPGRQRGTCEYNLLTKVRVVTQVEVGCKVENWQKVF